jgi:hypothetical protein
LITADCTNIKKECKPLDVEKLVTENLKMVDAADTNMKEASEDQPLTLNDHCSVRDSH